TDPAVNPNPGNLAILDPARPAPMPGVGVDHQARYNAYRWLAQLAVNVVDYIDSDDYITPFLWNPSLRPIAVDPTTGTPITDPMGSPQKNPTYVQDSVVFGTEQNRVSVNELYAEVSNSPRDSNPMTPPPGSKARDPFRVSFWLELHNTYRTGNPAAPADFVQS